jgi:hypothetical protein
VFWRLVAVIDTSLDFSRSLASQEEMCELVACYILATYFLEAFSVIGYLWPNGDKGSGKTTLEVHDVVTFSASELTVRINEMAMKEALADAWAQPSGG